MAHISVPTSIGYAGITLRAAQATVMSESPFTFSQQVVRYSGDRWEATVSIPSTQRDLAEPWVAFLLRCKGPVNTFNLGDPSGTSQRGNIVNMRITGSSGDDSVTVAADSGTIKAGDYFQVGTNANAKLYKALNDTSSGGTLDIFPRLRANATNTTVDLTSPVGTFRLRNPVTEWDINNAGFFGIQFDCVEVI
jgi:hypothetical protein